MPKFFLLLAASCCLSTRPASSQVLTPLAPRVVTLEAGDVARQAYICLDTATYRAVREQVAQVAPLKQRVQLLEYDRGLLTQSVAEQRRAGQEARNDFGQLAAITQKLEAQPLARPLLLDPHTYKGAALGGAALLALKFLFHF